jgi:thiol-disulfide isomerase/thioredoxin
MRTRIVAGAVAGALLMAACSANVDVTDVPELPTATTTDIEAQLTVATEPVVLNVWASWCIPCRSEGPLLSRAADEYGDRVQFVGINVRDTQDGARRFIAEFFPNAPIDHWFDAAGNVPVDLGGSRAVPLTYFYAPGGELVELHTGVLDERTLALQIDELLARAS